MASMLENMKVIVMVVMDLTTYISLGDMPVYLPLQNREVEYP